MWPFGREDDSLGTRGEKLARKFLRRRGMKILAVNYRCPAGEADLVALDPKQKNRAGAETIAIVEVKTRSEDKHTDPEAAVDAAKRRRMKRIAECYLAAHRAEEHDVRFDIVAIVLRDGREPEIKYIPDAF